MEHYEDRSSMQAPGLCFVCETAPQAGVVDTLQNFTPGFPSNLDGRKYICDGCVKSAAEACGFYASDDVAAANAKAEAAVSDLNALRDHVGNVVKSLEAGVVREVKAVAKPKAKKADVPA